MGFQPPELTFELGPPRFFTLSARRGMVFPNEVEGMGQVHEGGSGKAPVYTERLWDACPVYIVTWAVVGNR